MTVSYSVQLAEPCADTVANACWDCMYCIRLIFSYIFYNFLFLMKPTTESDSFILMQQFMIYSKHKSSVE